MEPRQEQQVEEQEEDMFFNAGRAANYAEQYAPSQRLKDTLLKSSSTSNNHHHDDINLQKQLNKQQQQSQSIQQYQTPQIATTTPIRTMNNSNNINNNTNTSNNSNTAMMNNITNNNPTINRNLPSTTSYNNSSIPTTESRLPTLPSLPSSILNSSSSANTASSTSNNEKALPILSSPGVVGVLTSDQKRKISLQYLAEISNFSRKDVQDAMVSKIDNESGEIYGNIPDIVVGMKYSSRMDLLDSKIHTDLQSDICTNGNYIKPVPAVIMHDTQERHEDRGTVVLYSIPFNGHHSDINTAPSIKGTPCEALAQNSIYKIPVRVVRGSYESSVDDGKRFRNGHCPTQGYRYDGIYFVGEYFYEPGASSFVFKLIRIYGQPELPHAPNLAEPPANRNNNQRPPNSQQGPPSNMPNMPNDRKIFGIPSFVTQRILSGSNQDYLAQSTRNSHNMPYIPSLPQNYSHSNNYNSQTNNPQNPHSLPAMPAMPNMNYNRNNFPNNNNSNMNNNYNEPPPQNNRQVMRGNNQSSSQSSFGSQSFPNNNNNNTNTNNNTTTGSTNNDGLNLSHTSVRQMINNLKFQNSNFGGRIQSYSYNISELATKVEDVQKTMPALGRQLTSRNKTFTWKLGQEKEQEEYDRTKYFVYDDEEDGSEDEDVEIERPSRSKKKKTHHIGSSSSGNISSGNNSVRTTPNDSNSTNSSSKSNNKQ